ncbi:phosphoribosylformylglycinamidine synthase [Brucella pituitosa]|uniref:phosphoribosylformylglycinamidine synthase n=1 Tax=Brucella pituitosa TaxID=571256 RepID=UPI003F4AA218
MSEVVKLQPVEVAEGFRFDPDAILEAAKGKGFETVAILGQLEDGSFWVSGSANAGETLILMERAKRQICFGEE